MAPKRPTAAGSILIIDSCAHRPSTARVDRTLAILEAHCAPAAEPLTAHALDDCTHPALIDLLASASCCIDRDEVWQEWEDKVSPFVPLLSNAPLPQLPDPLSEVAPDVDTRLLAVTPPPSIAAWRGAHLKTPAGQFSNAPPKKPGARAKVLDAQRPIHDAGWQNGAGRPWTWPRCRR